MYTQVKHIKPTTRWNGNTLRFKCRSFWGLNSLLGRISFILSDSVVWLFSLLTFKNYLIAVMCVLYSWRQPFDIVFYFLRGSIKKIMEDWGRSTFSEWCAATNDITESWYYTPWQCHWSKLCVSLFCFTSKLEFRFEAWGPSWTLATLGDPWRPWPTWLKMANFPPNGHFQACRQWSPRVAKVQRGPQGWLRLVRTKSIIFK